MSPGFFAPLDVPSVSGRDLIDDDAQQRPRGHRQSEPGAADGPERGCRDADTYYATLAYEATHWTAYESRLARDFGTTRFGSEDYAIEELEAELVLRSSVPTLI